MKNDLDKKFFQVFKDLKEAPNRFEQNFGMKKNSFIWLWEYGVAHI